MILNNRNANQIQPLIHIPYKQHYLFHKFFRISIHYVR